MTFLLCYKHVHMTFPLCYRHIPTFIQYGKFTILNTLALAPLIYVSCVIETPIKAIQEINIAIMWDGSTSTISQRMLIQSINNGGHKL